MIQTIVSASQNIQAQNNRQSEQPPQEDPMKTSFGDALDQVAKNNAVQNGETSKATKSNKTSQTDAETQNQTAGSALDTALEQALFAVGLAIRDQNADELPVQSLTGDTAQATQASLAVQQGCAEPTAMTALQTMAAAAAETEPMGVQIPTQTQTVATSAEGVQTATPSDDSMKPGNRFGQIRGMSSLSDGSAERITTESDETASVQTTDLPGIGSDKTAPTQKHAVEALETVLSKWSNSDSENEETSKTDKNSFSVLENNIQRMTSTVQPIKVSDASNEIAQPTVNQIIQEIKTNLSADQSEFTMQLKPNDLGELTVKMTAKDGILTIEMIASDPKTQNLLSERVGEIHNVLQSSQDKPIQISCPNQDQAQNQDLFAQSESQSQNRDQSDQQQQSDQTETVFQSTESFMSILQQIELQAV